jgi:hypothetical protein
VFIVRYLKLFVLEPDPHGFALNCSSVFGFGFTGSGSRYFADPDPDRDF